MNKTLGMLKFMIANTKNKKNEIALQECIKELEDLQNKTNKAIKELQGLKDLDKKSCNDCYYLKNISDNKYKCTNGNSYVNDILTGYANHHLTFRCRFFSKKLESKDA